MHLMTKVSFCPRSLDFGRGATAWGDFFGGKIKMNDSIGIYHNEKGQFVKGQKPFNFIHGMRWTSTYKIWEAMKRRCLVKYSTGYKWYGARGIKVCESWMTFNNFFTDMGERPKGLTLSRVDNNGNYCKENCRWATWYEQANNTRKNRFITFHGQTKTMTQWCRELNKSYGVVSNRINKHGWDPQRAIETPTRKGKIVIFQGKTWTLTQWCRKFNKNYKTISARVYTSGWDAQRAIETPIRKFTWR